MNHAGKKLYNQQMNPIKEKWYIIRDIILLYLDIIQFDLFLTRQENRPVFLSGLFRILYDINPEMRKIPFMSISWSGINLMDMLHDRISITYMTLIRENTFLYVDLIQSICHYYSPRFIFINFVLDDFDKRNYVLFTISNGKLITRHKKYDTIGKKLRKLWGDGTMITDYTIQELTDVLKDKIPVDIYCDTINNEKNLILIH